MILQYASDLHLEFHENKEFLKSNPLKPKGGILLLAGDIVPFAVMDMHKDFFKYVSDHFETTYWIPGNHEYYHFDAAKKCGTFNEKIKSNVFLVNNTSIIQGDTRFLFSTLWSKIRPSLEWQIERQMNDFHVIMYKGNRLSSAHFNQLHSESLLFLTAELEKPFPGKTVVMTHHLPTLINYPEKYKGNVLNDAFAVELFDLIEAKGPDFWIYGHTHFNTPEFEIGKTKLVTNQLGYVKYGEHSQFQNDFCLEIIV